MMITVRKANANEISWINEQYDEVGFKHSIYNNEFICIVEVDGKKVGLGRVQYLNADSAELGGVYVQEEYRQHKLATKIVSYLIQSCNEYKRIYCLPFSHLEAFYKKFGFEVVSSCVEVPSEIIEKHQWCNTTYGSETLLFVLKH